MNIILLVVVIILLILFWNWIKGQDFTQDGFSSEPGSKRTNQQPLVIKEYKPSNESAEQLEKRYIETQIFVDRHMPTIVDIDNNFHNKCHMDCTNKYRNQTNKGWGRCHYLCGVEVTKLIESYLNIKFSEEDFKKLNDTVHLFLPCLWVREDDQKKTCYDEYRQALIEFFMNYNIKDIPIISSQRRNQERNKNRRLYNDTYFTRKSIGNYDIITSLDNKTRKVRMMNFGTAQMFVADFDYDSLDKIKRKIDNIGFLWAIYRTSNDDLHYHIVNISKFINIDSEEATLLTQKLDADMNYLYLSRVARKYLLRYTPKYYSNYYTGSEAMSEATSEQNGYGQFGYAKNKSKPPFIPKFIEYYGSGGQDPKLMELLDSYNQLLHKQENLSNQSKK